MTRTRPGTRTLVVLLLASCTPTGGRGGGGDPSPAADIGPGKRLPCQVPGPGQCPNACAGGEQPLGGACANTGECACPNFCGPAGTCVTYAGEFAGCTCPGDFVLPPPPDIVEPPDLGPPEPDVGLLPPPADPGPPPPPDEGPDAPLPPPFVDIDDCPRPPPEGAQCNPYCQLGCEPGEHCTYTGSGTFGCLGWGGSGIDEVCTGFAECSEGHGCFGITGAPSAECHRFCIDNSDCPAGRPCALNVTFEGDVVATFCANPSNECDPFSAPEPQCGAAAGCYLTPPAGSTSCQLAGSLPQGAICWGLATNSCAPPLQCAVACTPICSLTGAPGAEPACEAMCAGGDVITLDPVLGAGMCAPAQVPKACELYDQIGCLPGDACYLVTGGWACAAEGAVPIGGACQFTNDCTPGTICVDSTCRRVCSLAANAVPTHACATKCAGAQIAAVVPQLWALGVCIE